MAVTMGALLGGIAILLIILIVLLIIVLILVRKGVLFYRQAKRKVEDTSMLIFNTKDIQEGIRQREKEVQLTPKSVAGATSIYLPMVMKDFPDFHYEEMKGRAENVLVSYLQSVDEENASQLSEGTNDLKEKLSMRIEMLQTQNKHEHFKNIKIHRTEIFKYRKEKGRCSVVFQSAVQYMHYFKQNEKIVKGAEDAYEQSRYNIEVMYIQDRDIVESTGSDGSLAMNCPNCGAPLKMLGAVRCEYCDTPIVEFNIKAWHFDQLDEC